MGRERIEHPLPERLVYSEVERPLSSDPFGGVYRGRDPSLSTGPLPRYHLQRKVQESNLIL